MTPALPSPRLHIVVVACPGRPVRLRARARAWRGSGRRRTRRRGSRRATAAHWGRGPRRHRAASHAWRRGGGWAWRRGHRRRCRLRRDGRGGCGGCGFRCCDRLRRGCGFPRRRFASRRFASRRLACCRLARRGLLCSRCLLCSCLARGRPLRRGGFLRASLACGFAHRPRSRASGLACRTRGFARGLLYGARGLPHRPARTGLLARCASLPTRFRSHGFCSDLLCFRSRPLTQMRRCTNRASLVQACRPAIRVNCFLHYTMIGSESGNLGCLPA